MLAKPTPAIPEGDGWLYEPKWDGFRSLAFRDGPELYLQSRDLKPFNRYFPELEPPLLALGGPDARFVLDGEIVIAGDDGGLDFDSLLIRIHPAASRVKMLSEASPASFVAFDCLAEGSDDLRERPFAERRARLEQLAASPPDAVHLTPSTTDPAMAQHWFDVFEGAGLDGVIAKAAGAAVRAREAGDGEDQARSHRGLRGRRLPLAQERSRHADRLAAAWPLERRGQPPARRGHLVLHDGQAAPSWSSSWSRTGAAARTTIRGASGRLPRRRPLSRAGACPARPHAGTGERTCHGSRCGQSSCARSPSTISRATGSAMPPPSSAGARTDRPPTADTTSSRRRRRRSWRTCSAAEGPRYTSQRCARLPALEAHPCPSLPIRMPPSTTSPTASGTASSNATRCGPRSSATNDSTTAGRTSGRRGARRMRRPTARRSPRPDPFRTTASIPSR